MLTMLPRTALALCGIASKENSDRMQVGAGETTCPMIGMVGASVAEHLRPSRHALTKLFRKCSKRGVAHPKGAEPGPREGNGRPARLRLGQTPGRLGRGHLIEDACEPCPSVRRLAKGEKFVSTGESRHPRDQNVLDVLKFKHGHQFRVRRSSVESACCSLGRVSPSTAWPQLRE